MEDSKNAQNECTEEQQRLQREITTLKNKRAGKKGGITKRINQIKKLVHGKQSRSGVTYLLGQIAGVVEETRLIAEQVFALTNDAADTLWIEELDADVDLCNSVVTDYLKSREDEPESIDGFTVSWAWRHGNADVDTTRQFSDDGLSEFRRRGAIPRTFVNDRHQSTVPIITESVPCTDFPNTAPQSQSVSGGFFGGGSINIGSLPSLFSHMSLGSTRPTASNQGYYRSDPFQCYNDGLLHFYYTVSDCLVGLLIVEL